MSRAAVAERFLSPATQLHHFYRLDRSRRPASRSASPCYCVSRALIGVLEPLDVQDMPTVIGDVARAKLASREALPRLLARARERDPGFVALPKVRPTLKRDLAPPPGQRLERSLLTSEQEKNPGAERLGTAA